MTAISYSRANPSPRYTELLGFYKQMHAEGIQEAGHSLPAQETFSGMSLAPHIGNIKSLIASFGAKSVFDYGAGKAKYYTAPIFPSADGKSKVDLKTFWGVDRIHLYDPGYAPLATLPNEQFDAVVCTDVMEHIPEQDLDWVIDELFGFARKLIYVCIATYPAVKRFPNGENVHVTLKDAKWWVEKFEARRKALDTPAHYFLLIFNTNNDPKPIAVTSA